MSTLKVNSIKNTSTDDGGIAIDNSGHVQVDGVQLPTAGALSNRNKIFNGDMRIDQRNSGSSVTFPTSSTYIVDRFLVEKNDMSTLAATIQQVSDGPAGFRHSLKTTVTTTETSSGDDRFVGADHRIEGYNWADMNFGTSNAQNFTLSFYVKSSVTGTYPVSFFNAGVNRAFLTTYTISSANTWERKTITVPGDTSGTWNTTNGIGLGFQMSLGTGSNDQGTAGTTWSSTYRRGTSDCVNLNETLNATWQITGVQIERGSKATEFEHRSYGDELARCQRYYETTYRSGYSEGHNFNQQYPFSDSRPAAINFIASDDTTSAVSFGYRVTKRTDPTVRLFSANTGASNKAHTYRNGAGNNSDVTVAAVMTTPNYCTIATSLNAVNRANEAYLHIVADSEL